MDINPEELARPYVAKEKNVFNRKLLATVGENPYIGDADRSRYVLAHLLEELPPRYKPLNDDTYLIAKAANHHIDNCLNTLIWGLDAIGAILTIAQMNDQYEVDKRKISALSELMQYMSIEMQYLREEEDRTASAIRAHESAPVATIAVACTCAADNGGV